MAVAEAEHLDLDVTGLGDQALQVHGAVAEAFSAIAWVDSTSLRVLRLVDPPHADAAAAGRCLDQQRIADPLAPPPRGPRGRAGAKRGLPGRTGTPAALAKRRARSLSPMSSIVLGVGPIQVKPSSCDALGKALFSARKP